MNQLEKTILDQHARVRAAGENPLDALEGAKGEILAVASQENTAEVLTRRNFYTAYSEEATSTRAQLRRYQHNEYLVYLANESLGWLRDLVGKEVVTPRQGYLGGVAYEHGQAIGIFGFAPDVTNLFDNNDPIQEAMGDTFYPPMMWAKALRAEAYRNRPESMRDLAISEYLATQGLSLGTSIHKDLLLGATGFMPGDATAGAINAPWPIGEHIASEETEPFRLSGFCDQAVVDPSFIESPSSSMLQVIFKGGSLN